MTEEKVILDMKIIWKRILDSISPMVDVLFLVGSLLVLSRDMMRTLLFVGIGVFVITLFLIILNFKKLSKREEELVNKSIRHFIWEDAFYHQLGELCTVVSSNKAKIILITFVNTLALVYAVGVMALFEAMRGNGFGLDAMILLIIALFLGIHPLRYWNEHLDYYEQGFCFCGFIYLYSQVGKPVFTSVESSRAIGGLHMSVKGDSMNVSYLKDVRKKYVKAYMNCAVDTSQNI